jgi:hypothetical protein
LHLAQGREDQTLKELVVLLSGARGEVALCEAVAGESGQKVEFGSLLGLFVRGTPVTTHNLSVDFGQPVLRLEAGQEWFKRFVPMAVRTYIASPEGAAASFDASEGPPAVALDTPKTPESRSQAYLAD